MNTKSIAQMALRFTKAATPKGCSNQGAGHLSPIQPGTPIRHPGVYTAIDRLHAQTPRPGCSMMDILAYGLEVLNEQCGDCQEQCAVVCLFLSRLPEPPLFQLVNLVQPGDHAFVVIDQLPDEEGFFPDRFQQWNTEAVIIDPWVNICTLPRFYPVNWQIKLDIMNDLNIELCAPDNDDDYQWVKANNPFWRYALTTFRKYAYTHP